MSGNIIGKTLLNQYRVDAFVASGGMGAVYRVWDMKRNVPLAMKVLHSDLAEDPSVLKRFQREARALKKLTHPNIVPFYGLNQTSDFFFLLERYIDGPTLKDILRSKRGPLPLEETLVYFTTLCAALGFAHHNDVVHCDVKPGNVMVDRGGNIYLTDFGIARHAESTMTTFAGAGTPAYMAPEQIRQEVVSPAADVYALGIILYEMLTGVRPFRGDEASLEKKGDTSGERIRYAQLNANAPDPRQLNPSIPEELISVINRAMAKSSSERYQNATEMLRAIQIAVGAKSEDLPNRVDVSSYSQSFSTSIAQDISEKPAGTSRQIQSSLIIKVIAITGSFILMAAVGIFAANRIGNSPEPPSATSTFSTSIPSTKPPTRGAQSLPTNTAVIAIPPDASSNWIAYTYGADQDSTGTDPRYLEIVNLRTGEKRRLTFDEGGINFPSFSPRGDQIVYTGCRNDDCKLFIIDIDTGNIEKLAGISMKAMWPSWCPDNNLELIAFEGRIGSERKIYIYDLSTQTASAITDGSFDIRPSWSSDCSKIVFLRDFNGQDDIYIYDLKQDREYAVLESSDDEFNVSWAPDGDHIMFTRVSLDTNGDGFVNLNDRSDLLLMNSDGSGVITLSNGQYSVFSPSFSPDGNRIIFVAYRGSSQSQQIMVYSFADDSFKSITNNGPYNHTDWSP